MRTLNAYPALLHAYLMQALVYRAMFIVWNINAIFPLMMMFIWLALVGNGTIVGYSKSDFAAYYLAVILVRRITNCWIVQDIDDLIRTGELSIYLLKPVSLVHHLFAKVLASRVMASATVVVPVVLAFIVIPAISIKVNGLNMLMFGLICIVGLFFQFVIQYLIGATAFWITQAQGIGTAAMFVISLLGGYVAPLPLFPPEVRAVLHWLPFQSTIGLPVEILIGQMPLESALGSVIVCVVWVFVLSAVASIAWKAGLKEFHGWGA